MRFFVFYPFPLCSCSFILVFNLASAPLYQYCASRLFPCSVKQQQLRFFSVVQQLFSNFPKYFYKPASYHKKIIK
jgi:hypothetical protein